MSGIVKGVKKVFKKVGKVVKKVAPIALVAGAVIFTAGAAMGLPAMAGGWGAAVTNGLGALGISGGSGLAGALAGAITQAGYGAAAGGLISWAQGGDFMDGATTGAMAGAVTGGVMGGLGMPTDPLKGIGRGGAEVTSAATENLSALPEGVIQPGAAGGGVGAAPVQAPTQAAPVAGNGLAPATAPAAGGAAQPSTFDKILGSPITGHVVKGIGGALMAGSEGDSEREDRRARAASYRMDPGASGLMPSQDVNRGLRPPNRVFPNSRMAEETIGNGGGSKPSVRYDPATGTILWS